MLSGIEPLSLFLALQSKFRCFMKKDNWHEAKISLSPGRNKDRNHPSKYARELPSGGGGPQTFMILLYTSVNVTML